ncbi:hypothetical protein FPHOBKDP_00198 [Listeria phage LPJP1]|nr:hypothetical protein FPHOBKDP_00198 [Listeria phage LPJP1]
MKKKLILTGIITVAIALGIFVGIVSTNYTFVKKDNDVKKIETKTPSKENKKKEKKVTIKKEKTPDINTVTGEYYNEDTQGYVKLTKDHLVLGSYTSVEIGHVDDNVVLNDKFDKYQSKDDKNGNLIFNIKDKTVKYNTKSKTLSIDKVDYKQSKLSEMKEQVKNSKKVDLNNYQQVYMSTTLSNEDLASIVSKKYGNINTSNLYYDITEDNEQMGPHGEHTYIVFVKSKGTDGVFADGAVVNTYTVMTGVDTDGNITSTVIEK